MLEKKIDQSFVVLRSHKKFVNDVFYFNDNNYLTGKFSVLSLDNFSNQPLKLEIIESDKTILNAPAILNFNTHLYSGYVVDYVSPKISCLVSLILDEDLYLRSVMLFRKDDLRTPVLETKVNLGNRVFLKSIPPGSYMLKVDGFINLYPITIKDEGHTFVRKSISI